MNLEQSMKLANAAISALKIEDAAVTSVVVINDVKDRLVRYELKGFFTKEQLERFYAALGEGG